jgi:hypothetical protein
LLVRWSRWSRSTLRRSLRCILLESRIFAWVITEAIIFGMGSMHLLTNAELMITRIINAFSFRSGIISRLASTALGWILGSKCSWGITSGFEAILRKPRYGGAQIRCLIHPSALNLGDKWGIRLGNVPQHETLKDSFSCFGSYFRFILDGSTHYLVVARLIRSTVFMDIILGAKHLSSRQLVDYGNWIHRSQLFKPVA